MITPFKIFILSLFSLPLFVKGEATICVNQIGYDTNLPKKAVIMTGLNQFSSTSFNLIDALSGRPVFQGLLLPCGDFKAWGNRRYYRADFSRFKISGKYYIRILTPDTLKSPIFEIAPNILAERSLPSLIHYFRNQRANTAIEKDNDRSVRLFGSEKTVDLSGGWCDASGDVSKYFSHLSYANFFSPQQIPLVTWSLADAADRMPLLLKKLKLTDSVRDETVYGADYLLKSLSEEGYFYMIVFSYFDKDPKARRVVGLHANSKTTDEYQCAFREGGGMAIASLAKIARWNSIGHEKQVAYLNAAKRAYSHLRVNNKKYCDDGKENIIDDYCALMAATELYRTTKEEFYLLEARAKVLNLKNRLSPGGYFIADENSRPFFHASDAGMPLVALRNYIHAEPRKKERDAARRVMNVNLNYQLQITSKEENPFGYARQTIQSSGKVAEAFFIPHVNETGWWWQGENARLASLAAAVFSADRKPKPLSFATDQLNWILGSNPYSTCFMYGFGDNNVPYMASNYGHGSQIGGISNGITGSVTGIMGDGIEFKREAKGEEWRWTEQWLPHAAWFLQAITSLQNEN